jgi:hypothetical protein
VIIGQDMDRAAMAAALERCVMTDEEMAVYTKVFREASPPWLVQGRLDEAEARYLDHLEFHLDLVSSKKRGAAD